MDGQSAQQEKPVVFTKFPGSMLNKVVFVSVTTLLLGFFLGFLIRSLEPFNKVPSLLPQQVVSPSSLSQKPTLDESKLPISLSLLTNPIVYEWRGSVKGKLVNKNEHTFTLVDDKGNSITITDIMATGDKWKTIFFEQISQKEQKESSLSAIPIGSTLLGDFFIFKGGPNIPVGGLFVKQ